MLNTAKKRHVKWAMMRSSNVKKLSDSIHEIFGINDIEIFESTINDKEGNVVADIWVLEFDADEDDVEIIKSVAGLEEVQGYLM